MRKDTCVRLFISELVINSAALCVCEAGKMGGTTIFMAQREFGCFRQEVSFREPFLMLGVEGRG